MSTTIKVKRKTNQTKTNTPNINSNHSFSTMPQYTLKEVADTMGLTRQKDEVQVNRFHY